MDPACDRGDPKDVVLRKTAAEQDALDVAPVAADNAFGQEFNNLFRRPALCPVRIESNDLIIIGRKKVQLVCRRDRSDDRIIPLEVLLTERGMPPPIGGLFGKSGYPVCLPKPFDARDLACRTQQTHPSVGDPPFFRCLFCAQILHFAASLSCRYP